MSSSNQVPVPAPQASLNLEAVLGKCGDIIASNLKELLAALKYIIENFYKFKHLINILAKRDDPGFTDKRNNLTVKYMVNPEDGSERLIYHDSECASGWSITERVVNLMSVINDIWGRYWPAVKQLDKVANVGGTWNMLNLDGFLAARGIKGFANGGTKRAWYSTGITLFTIAASITLDAFIMSRTDDHNVFLVAQMFTEVILAVGGYQVIQSDGLSGWTAALWLFEWTMLRLPSQSVLLASTFAGGLEYGGVIFYVVSVLGRVGLTAVRSFGETLQRVLVRGKVALMRLASQDPAKTDVKAQQDIVDDAAKELNAGVKYFLHTKKLSGTLSVGTDRDSSAVADRLGFWSDFSTNALTQVETIETNNNEVDLAEQKRLKRFQYETAWLIAGIWIALSIRSPTLLISAIPGCVLLLADATRDLNRDRISGKTMTDKIDQRGNGIVLNLMPIGLQLWISGPDCFDSILRCVLTVVITGYIFCAFGDKTGEVVRKLLAPVRGLLGILNWIASKCWYALSKLWKKKASEDAAVTMEDIVTTVDDVVAEGMQEDEPSRIDEVADPVLETADWEEVPEEVLADEWLADFKVSNEDGTFRFSRPIKPYVDMAGMRLRIVPRPIL